MAHSQSRGMQHLQEDDQAKNDNVSSSSSNNNHVTVDPDKVKQGMAALFPSGDFDTDDLANAFVAVLEGAS